MNQQKLIGKDKLAKLLAREDILVKYLDVSTAAWDLENRELILPTFSKDCPEEITDLFVGHEVGHALYTSPENLPKGKLVHEHLQDLYEEVDGENPDSVAMTYNILEDARIERLLVEEFPGLRQVFRKGYQELMERDFFGLEDKDINSLHILDKVNIHYKMGENSTIEFKDDEKWILEEVDKCQTFEDLTELVPRVHEFSKRDKRENPEEEVIEIEIPGDEKGQGPPQYGNDGGVAVETAFIPDQDNEPITMENFLAAMEEMFAEQDKDDPRSLGNSYVNIPEVTNKQIRETIRTMEDVYQLDKENPEAWNVDLENWEEKKDYDKYRAGLLPEVRYLTNKFNQLKKGVESRNTRSRRSGELNMGKLWQYKLEDKIFNQIEIHKDAKNHGFQMFIDWSGSMGNHLLACYTQALKLALFCKAVNIPFDVYTWTNRVGEHYHSYWEGREKYHKMSDEEIIKAEQLCSGEHHRGPVAKWEKTREGEFLLDDIVMVQLLSSRMSKVQFETAVRYFWEDVDTGLGWGGSKALGLGGTPMAASIIYARQISENFKISTGVDVLNVVFLSDGGDAADGISYWKVPEVGIEIEDTVDTMNFTNPDGTERTVQVPSRKVPDNARDYGYNRLRSDGCHFIDRISRKVYYLDYGHQYPWIHALLQQLKDRVECNLLGFYAFSGGGRDLSYVLSPNMKVPGYTGNRRDYDEVKFKSWQRKVATEFKNTSTVHISGECTGYDEFYLLPIVKPKKLKTSEHAGLTKTKMRKAFKDSLLGKRAGRLILDRIVNAIAAHL